MSTTEPATSTTESLLKAHTTAALLIADLRDALKTAAAVEALVILPLIEQSARLDQGIAALISARADSNPR